MSESAREYAIREMRNTLVQVAKQFEFYAKNHLAKEPPDTTKAETNLHWANTCKTVIAKYDIEKV